MKYRKQLLALALALACKPLLAEPDFQACLAQLQQRAVAAGVDSALAAAVVPELEQQTRVLELDGKQPEFVQTFGQYLAARVTAQRVEKGRELYAEHRQFLDGLTKKYGVPGRYLVAFWGLETNFGSYLGNMPTLDSLATLACDERRSEFFSVQLITALQLMQRDSLQAEAMRGSWAGAVGHTQFMPSAYMEYAVDGDGDGGINLWTSKQDALASGANFLQQLGWVRGMRWGREVRLNSDFPFSRAGLDSSLTLSQWAQLGVRRADGSSLPSSEIEGSILVPAGFHGPAFLVYDNFQVIMRWNRSESYAIAVGHLADRIAGAGTLLQPPPPGQKALSQQQVLQLQQRLAAAGYPGGGTDGIFGPATRAALSAFQADAGMVADGFPDAASLQSLSEYATQP
ncbi:MAG: lytic murein transglycosylase [Halieaceae bacterium]